MTVVPTVASHTEWTAAVLVFPLDSRLDVLDGLRLWAATGPGWIEMICVMTIATGRVRLAKAASNEVMAVASACVYTLPAFSWYETSCVFDVALGLSA
jgi:hypothetical protein